MGLTRVRAYQVSDSDYKQAVRVISRSNVTLAGGAPSQVDGVNLVQNDRVLVAGQLTASQNGIYVVTTLGTGSNGTWTRAIDSNQTGEIQAGMIVMVTEGNLYDDTQWKLITDDPIVVGTTPLSFELNSAYAFSTIAVAGQSNIKADTVDDTFNVAAGNNIIITTDANTSTLTIASSLTSLSKITNGTSNVDVSSANGNVTIGVNGTPNVAIFGSTDTTLSGNLLPAANVTYSLGSTTNRWKDLWLSNSTLYLGAVALSGNATSLTYGSNVVLTSSNSTTMSLSGNVTAGNILTGGLVSATGSVTGANITGSNLLTGGIISAAGTITGANITGSNLLTNGVISAAGTITGGNLGITGTISASGNITCANVIAITHIGNLSGTSVNVSNNVTGGNLFTSGEISAAGRIQGANVIGSNFLTTGAVSATGNVTGSYFIGNGSQLTGIVATAGTLIENGTSNVTVINNSNITVGVGGISNVAVFHSTGLRIANTLTALNIDSTNADLAERYLADNNYAVGTVLAIGGTCEVTQSNSFSQSSVVGTVSEAPAVIMNKDLQGNNVVTIALMGRVPCRVVGSIARGDLLVSSNIPGVATRMESYVPGSILGKALQSYNSDTPGLIEIIVGRL
jgi:hypothetical protein